MNDRARILVIILVVAVVGGIAGIGIYRERVAPFRMVVLRVDDDVQVRMGGSPASTGSTGSASMASTTVTMLRPTLG